MQAHIHTHIVAHLTLIIIQYIDKILFAITNFRILCAFTSKFDALLLLFMANKQILHKNELKEALIALSLWRNALLLLLMLCM